MTKRNWELLTKVAKIAIAVLTALLGALGASAINEAWM
jgi:hypothetical protein